MNKLRVFFSVFALLFIVALNAQQNNIINQLQLLPGIEISPVKTDEMFEGGYLIMMSQPIDHDNPALGTFKQRIWLSHLNEKAPMVMVTEGYAAPRIYTTELAKNLKANQLIVEHRYFQKSTPLQKDWKYLTVKQAAADHHEIIKLFKKVYKGKWLTTGISKGGQTTLFHIALYPKDVDVSVPYVAPINMYKEDPRLLEFFHHVGIEKDRANVKRFQEIVLQREDALLPMFIKESKAKGWNYSMGYNKAYEMAVLEYPFAFWQWGISVDSIPTNDSSDEKVLKHFILAASPDYFADNMMTQYKSFFYQAFKELGYYNYVTGDLRPLMTCIKQDTVHNSMFAPGGDTLIFNRNTMLEVVRKLNKSNPKMVLIYGEYDPWGSTMLDVSNMSKSYCFVKPKGSHKTRIGNLPTEERDEVWAILRKWMKVD